MAFRTGAAYTNPTAEEVYAPNDNNVMTLRRVYPQRRPTRDAQYYQRLRAFVQLRVAALVDHMAGRVPPRVLHVGWPVTNRRHRQWVGLPAKLNDHFNTDLTLDQGVDSVSPPLELATWVLADFKPRGKPPHPAGETRAQCLTRLDAHYTAWRTRWILAHRYAYWRGGDEGARDRGGRYHPTLRLAPRDIRPPNVVPHHMNFYADLPNLIDARLRAQCTAYLSRLVHRYVNWDVRNEVNDATNNQWQLPKFLHLSQRPFWTTVLIDRGTQSAETILDVIRAHVDAFLRLVLTEPP